MNKPETVEHKVDRFFCEICIKRVIQDGKDIVLLYEKSVREESKMIFHFHNSCLIKHLKKTYVPSP